MRIKHFFTFLYYGIPKGEIPLSGLDRAHDKSSRSDTFINKPGSKKSPPKRALFVWSAGGRPLLRAGLRRRVRWIARYEENGGCLYFQKTEHGELMFSGASRFLSACISYHIRNENAIFCDRMHNIATKCRIRRRNPVFCA